MRPIENVRVLALTALTLLPASVARAQTGGGESQPAGSGPRSDAASFVHYSCHESDNQSFLLVPMDGATGIRAQPAGKRPEAAGTSSSEEPWYLPPSCSPCSS